MPDLDRIMKPASIALIGASTKAHAIGSDLLKRLIEFGFKGRVYPVNPKGGIIEGLPAYTSLDEVPEAPDLAIIAVRNSLVLAAVDDCHRKGVGGLVVISAGFKETGPEGAELERQLSEKVAAYGLRCVGPNCLGVVNTDPAVSLDGCFAERLPRRGDIGFVSQSGALGGGILNILKDLGLGFAQFISIGNQMDVNAETAIEYWEDVPDVRQILLYMESVRDPENFRRLATRVSRRKPIIALKAGRSAAGASAASSHTGSLAGSDRAADALLRQSGVIREFSLEKLFATAKLFAGCPVPAGNRVAIVTNSGGPGIMATDAIIDHGMSMAVLSDETKAALRSFLPATASVKNPVDMIASAPLEHYRQTCETVLADPGVDMAVVIYLPFLGLRDVDVARELGRVRAAHPDKPLVGVFMTENRFFAEMADSDLSLPLYMYAEQAVEALARLDQYRRWRERPLGEIPSLTVDRERAAAVIAAARADGRDQLTTDESIAVLDAYGISVCRGELATSEEEAVAAAARVGWPVVMKMTSKTVSHKTDVGGVVVNIKDESALRASYRELVAALAAKGLSEGLEGVIIQRMVIGQRELVCGVARDPQYGPLIMFGLGGVYVEVLKDVSFALAPLTDQDARDLIRSVKAFKLLEGARGAVPADLAEVEETLARVSRLALDFPVEELDINPLMIDDRDGRPVAVDGRIRLRRA